MTQNFTEKWQKTNGWTSWGRETLCQHQLNDVCSPILRFNAAFAESWLPRGNFDFDLDLDILLVFVVILDLLMMIIIIIMLVVLMILT